MFSALLGRFEHYRCTICTNITSACRDRDYAEDRCYTHIHTFQIKVLPGILNYVTSSCKGWDARVHEAVEDPPKCSLVTVRPIIDFYA